LYQKKKKFNKIQQTLVENITSFFKTLEKKIINNNDHFIIPSEKIWTQHIETRLCPYKWANIFFKNKNKNKNVLIHQLNSDPLQHFPLYSSSCPHFSHQFIFFSLSLLHYIIFFFCKSSIVKLGKWVKAGHKRHERIQILSIVV
jgi:hypothetical protein